MLKKSFFGPRAEVVKLGEDAVAKETDIAPFVQLIRTGSFHHPEYGKFDVTKEHLKSFVKNFNEKIRGVDIAIDYKHDNDDVAAGWIQELYLDELEEKLMARVRWTPGGSRVLTDREFRYLSAEFDINYQDAETLNTFGPTLLGAGLTNRPFIKGMEPVVQLSEKEEGDKMTLEQAMAKIAELEAKLNGMGDMQKQLDEYANKEKEKLAKEKELEKKKLFDEKLTAGVFVEAQRVAFMEGDIMKLAELAVAVKTEKLSENSTENNNDKSAEDQVIDIAQKLLSEGKASDIGEATSMVLMNAENKTLREKYEATKL